jgi:putative DNA primase/helicase
MREKIAERARGRWREILQALGVPAKLLDSKHHPCPHCGGKDRFRFTNYNGTGGHICTGCGNGSGFDLLMKLKGWDFKTAAQEVEKIIGSCARDARTPERDEADKRTAMNGLWRAAKPPAPDDPVGRYLWHRCRVTTYPPCLRSVAALQYSGERARYSAMLAKVTAPDGRPSNIHRTYLTAT